MPVLVFLADDDGDFLVLPQGDVAHQYALVLNIIAVAVDAQVIIHVMQGFQVVGVIDVIHLFADVQVLVPGKGNLVVAIVRNQADVVVNNAYFHAYIFSIWRISK